MIRSYQRVLTKCMIPAKTKNGPKSLPMRRILWLEGRLGLGDAEALLVQGPADDHAAQVVESELRESAEIVERPDAAGVDQLPVGRRCGLAERVEVGALHQAVDFDGRVDEPADPSLGERGDHLRCAEV